MSGYRKKLEEIRATAIKADEDEEIARASRRANYEHGRFENEKDEQLRRVKSRLEAAAKDNEKFATITFDEHNYGKTYVDLMVEFLKNDDDLAGFEISNSFDPGCAPQYGTGMYTVTVSWK